MNEIMAITRKLDKMEVDRKRIIEKTFMMQNDELLKARKEAKTLREQNSTLKSMVSELQQKLKQQ